MSISILGFSSTDKVPGFYGENKYGAGSLGAGDVPQYLLICGLKKSGYSSGLTVDTDVVDILSEDDADTYWGAGGEGAMMAYAALRIPGVRIKGCAPTEGVGATAATATITIAGTPTAAGTWTYRIDGQTLTGGISTSDTPTTIAAAIAAAVQGKTRLPCSAASALGVVTLTWKSKGPRGNDGVVFQDKSLLAAGVTSTLGGSGTALTSSKGGEDGITFASGATAEDVTNMLTTLFPGTYDMIAAAQADATNLALWKTQLGDKMGPLEGRLEDLVIAARGTLSAAQSTSKTTLNDISFQNAWFLNSETHPSEIAAVLAATRLQAEQDNPNSGFDGVVLPGVAPQANRADWPQHSTLVSALDNGVTPLATTETGEVVIVRSIGTHCLNGSDPDYRTLDTSETKVPKYVRKDLRLFWTTDFVVANPHVRDDPADGEKDPPAGVANPKRWSAAATAKLLEYQDAQLITEVETHPVVSEFDSTAKRIMSAVPVVVLPIQHQIGVSVRQQNV